MKKEYINCKLAMTPNCPHRNHQFMLDLFVSPVSPEKPIKQLTDEIINKANSLCAKCGEFTPKD